MKVIVGGGIAGLWLAAEYKYLGIPFLLIEKNFLGSDQTLASQGMIHGGTKYSLNGYITKSSTEISKMPKVWRDAIAGVGNVKLDKIVLEQNFQYLWSSDNISSKVTGFFASKLMNSKLLKINQKDDVTFLSSKEKLILYKLNEPIINVKKTIEILYDRVEKHCFKADVKKINLKEGLFSSIDTDYGEIKASEIILTAGIGNEKILKNSEIYDLKIQKRPLAMSVVFVKGKIPKLYGHYFGLGSKPIMTISTHNYLNGTILYLGGEMAESGVLKTDKEQIEETKKILKKTLPWINLKIQKISILRIDRSEPFFHNRRPEKPFIYKKLNLIVGWPIKLAFAPLLAKKILEINSINYQNYKIGQLQKISVGDYPWD